MERFPAAANKFLSRCFGGAGGDSEAAHEIKSHRLWAWRRGGSVRSWIGRHGPGFSRLCRFESGDHGRYVLFAGLPSGRDRKIESGIAREAGRGFGAADELPLTPGTSR